MDLEKMEITANNKVFISYSWDTEGDMPDNVSTIVKSLENKGIEVVYDKKVLKLGHDLFKFMEKMVNDESIKKVLIMCDKNYATKANNRKGGAGTETQIISAEVYGNAVQTKFIPIVLENDADGNPSIPTYLKSRFYLDMSSPVKIITNFSKLLSAICDETNMDSDVKSELESTINNSDNPLKKLISIIDKIDTERYNPDFGNVNADDFKRELIKCLNEIESTSKVDGIVIINKIGELKPFLGIYIRYLGALIHNGYPLNEILPGVFEEIYNSVGGVKSSFMETQFEYYEYYLWEIFLYTVSILIRYGKYSIVHSLLAHTYYLRGDYFSFSKQVASNYLKFRRYFKGIEEFYKPNSEFKNTRSLTSEILFSRIPEDCILSQQELVISDILLFQMSYLLGFSRDDSKSWPIWFPNTYIYLNENEKSWWVRLSSREYCEKIFPLFNVNTVDELKKLIATHPIRENIGYQNLCMPFANYAPSITKIIPLENIASKY